MVEDGPLLPTETARRLACDSRWQLFADFEGQTVGIGRISRRIPASLLRALRLRDRCCRFPGCERTRWLHAHHLVHWANGGRTDLENLVLLCGDHHRFVHEGGWTISGDPNNGIEFITRHGRPYAPKHHPLDRERMARLVAATGRPPGSGPDPPFPPPEAEVARAALGSRDGGREWGLVGGEAADRVPIDAALGEEPRWVGVPGEFGSRR